MTQKTASELFHLLGKMDSDTEDALTRFYLRLIKGDTWSYQIRKENILQKEQSQEAYRKKLNKFVKLGFLEKGKRYYVDGKPRNPFRPNLNVIGSVVKRYSFTKYEEDAAMVTFKDLVTDDSWQSSLDEKLYGKTRISFYQTLFPLVFMGPEISRFFFKLLFISVSKQRDMAEDEESFVAVQGLLGKMMSHIELDIAHVGIDYVGKRMFLDIYLKDVMCLLYAIGATEKHWDLMKIALLEDITLPLLTPTCPLNCNEKDFKKFENMSFSKRFDHMISYVSSVDDHFVAQYYGEGWERELASYIAYAITTSITSPNDSIKEFLRHIQKKYGVTKKVVDSVAVKRH